MSLHAAAQHISNRGRGPDNTLVHMSHDEVKSLNDLARAHGGQLTINPDTGLPEAGFLSAILPTLAGAALAATGIGIPAAALLVGGGTTIATGSLEKGLMAGLGAYGGAGLGSSLMGAGAAVPEAASAALPEAASAATPTAAAVNPLAGLDVSGVTTAGVAPAAPAAVAPASTQASILNSPAFTPPTPTAPTGFNPSQITGMSGANSGIASANPTAMPATTTAQPDLSYMTRGMGATPASASASAPPTFTENLKSMGRGISLDNVANWGKENPYSAAALVGSVYAGMQKPPEENKIAEDNDRGAMANAGYKYDPGWSSPMPTPSPTGQEQVFAKPRWVIPGKANGGSISGGLSDLGGYSDGGHLLRGPGDGVSDSIPAMIGKKQPARLADGEFVVPARIVSELGNGSTDAGARKLYAMMDRVQAARKKSIGKGKVANNSRADKLLPA